MRCPQAGKNVESDALRLAPPISEPAGARRPTPSLEGTLVVESGLVALELLFSFVNQLTRGFVVGQVDRLVRQLDQSEPTADKGLGEWTHLGAAASDDGPEAGFIPFVDLLG